MTEKLPTVPTPIDAPPSDPHEPLPEIVPVPTPPGMPAAESHGGATEKVGDRSGPGAGFNNEPAKVKDKGGVASS